MEVCPSGWPAESSSSGPGPAFSPPVSPPAGATARFAAGRADPSNGLGLHAPAEPAFILASGSPRRRQILASVGLSFSVHPVDLDEHPLDGELPEALALRLATCKAVEGARRFPRRAVLGADTVVALGSQSVGKPESPEQATQMLRALRGRTHRVITAVAAARLSDGERAPHQWSRTSVADVEMRVYGDAEIADYVASGDPLDKAGAYAIQHARFRPVRRLSGCYLTVMGLALPEVFEVLAEAGLDVEPISGPALHAICPGCKETGRLPIKPL